MPDPTPGQIAYAAYLAALDSHWTKPAWRWLLPAIHRAWEAAAQAVRDAGPDGYQFAVGQTVRRTDDPQRDYQVHSRGRESTARGPELVWYRLVRQGYVLDRVAEDMLETHHEDTP
jgi:hypothetical protein